MSVVLLVRHANASFGLGSYDRLSDQGKAQARQPAATLVDRRLPIERIISGSLQRQQETAELLSAALGGRPVAVDPRWDEYDHMPLIARVKPMYRRQWVMTADLARTGNPGQRLQEVLDTALTAWADDPTGARAPDHDVETFDIYRERVRAALDDAAAHDGTTLVVSSAGSIAAAAAPLLGVEPGGWPALQRVMVNTSVTKVVRGQRGITLISFNEHGHLEGVPGVKVTYR